MLYFSNPLGVGPCLDAVNDGNKTSSLLFSKQHPEVVLRDE